MKESDFGRQYFNIFGAAKDTVSTNVASTCRQEGIDDRIAQKIIATAHLSIEQAANNAYPSFWGQVQKFFRK
jgi:hypothetical protein